MQSYLIVCKLFYTFANEIFNIFTKVIKQYGKCKFFI